MENKDLRARLNREATIVGDVYVCMEKDMIMVYDMASLTMRKAFTIKDINNDTEEFKNFVQKLQTALARVNAKRNPKK